MKKKGLLILMFCLCQVMGWAYGFEVDGIYYNRIDGKNGEVEVTGGYYSGDIIIPPFVSHDEKVYTVTGIGEGAFFECSELISVSLSEYITEIAFNSFVFTPIISITISPQNPNYTSINGVLYTKDEKTLLICPGGKTGEFLIPEHVTSIRIGAFADCVNLTHLYISKNVTTIEDAAFIRCNNITSIIVDENNEFYSSSENILYNKDKTVIVACMAGKTGECNIPYSVTAIGEHAFMGCTKLTSFDVDISNKYYSSQNGVLFDKDVTKLIFYPSAKVGGYTIPNTVEDIGTYAFYAVNGLPSLLIPASIKNISYFAFYGCVNLDDIYVLSPTPPASVYDSFVEINDCVLHVPEGSESTYENASGWSNFNIIVGDVTDISLPSLSPIIFNYDISESNIEITGIDDRVIISILDTAGNLMIRNEITKKEIISLNSFPIGMYIIHLQTADKLIVKKIIKK